MNQAQSSFKLNQTGSVNIIMVVALGIIGQLLIFNTLQFENANQGIKLKSKVEMTKRNLLASVTLPLFSRSACTMNFKNISYVGGEQEVPMENLFYAKIGNPQAHGEKLLSVKDVFDGDTIVKIALRKDTAVTVGSLAYKAYLDITAMTPGHLEYAVSVPGYIIFTDKTYEKIDTCMLTALDSTGRTFEDRVCQERGEGDVFDPSVFSCVDAGLAAVK